MNRQYWTAVLMPQNDTIWGQPRKIKLTHPNLLGMSQPELFGRIMSSSKFWAKYAGYELIDLY